MVFDFMRLGVCFGVDVGKVCVGVFVCDWDGLLVILVVILIWGSSMIEDLCVLFVDYMVMEVVVGLLLLMWGVDMFLIVDVWLFVGELVGVVELFVCFVDEWLLTVFV